MTELLRALTAFLTRAGLPVYLTGQIPDGAAFPYAALTLTDAPFARPAALELTGWHRGEHANTDAAGFLNRMAALIPESGALLTLPHGRVTLHRAETFRAVTTDRDAIGGRVTLECRRYIAKEES